MFFANYVPNELWSMWTYFCFYHSFHISFPFPYWKKIVLMLNLPYHSFLFPFRIWRAYQASLGVVWTYLSLLSSLYEDKSILPLVYDLDLICYTRLFSNFRYAIYFLLKFLPFSKRFFFLTLNIVQYSFPLCMQIPGSV